MYFNLSGLLWTFRIVTSLLFILAVTLPVWANAQEADDSVVSDKLVMEIESLLTYGNVGTEVKISQCILQIKTPVLRNCADTTEPNWKATTIFLSEVRSLKFSSYADGLALDVEFDVSSPSILKTFINRQTKGNEAAFDAFIVESDRLLAESTITSNVTFRSCKGLGTPQKKRSITLFFEAKPSSWDSFEALVTRCH